MRILVKRSKTRSNSFSILAARDMHQRKPLAFMPALFEVTRKREHVPLEEVVQEACNSASDTEGALEVPEGGATACMRPYVLQEIVPEGGATACMRPYVLQEIVPDQSTGPIQADS
jgi:hypothetical protein